MARVLRASLGLATVAALASSAWADLTVAYYKSYKSHHTVDILNPTPTFVDVSGGEYLMDPVGFSALYRLPDAFADPARGDDWFETFCLERDEFIGTVGVQYHATIDDFAVEGGVGGGSPDPLSAQTAYLYDQFIRGTLTGYHYANGSIPNILQRIASANALQDAIWYFEDELPGINVADMSAAAQGFIADALAHAGGLGGVRVLNVFKDDGTPMQSVLVSVPVPAAVGLGLVGMGILALGKRWVS